jgi:protein-tyrosine phosphatase
VRSGIFYRTEGPKNFVGRHLADLKALGVRAIFDLRSDGERERDPHDWHDDNCQWLALDMNTDLRAADTTEWERLRDDPDPALSRLVMSQNYAAMPGALLPHWQLLATTLLRGAVPAIINCTAGNLKSDIFGRNMVLQGSIEQGFMESFGFMPNQAAVDALIGVDAAYLLSALDQIDTGWGGIKGYCDAAGVDADMRRDLTALLTTDQMTPSQPKEI